MPCMDRQPNVCIRHLVIQYAGRQALSLAFVVFALRTASCIHQSSPGQCFVMAILADSVTTVATRASIYDQNKDTRRHLVPFG